MFGCLAWSSAVLVFLLGVRHAPAAETHSNLAHIGWISGNLLWMTGELWENDDSGPSDNPYRTSAVGCQALGLAVSVYALLARRGQPAHAPSPDEEPNVDAFSSAA